MTRTRHDLFAKQYFAALLSPFGTVDPSHKIISETRETDLLLSPFGTVDPSHKIISETRETDLLFIPHKFLPHETTAADRQSLGLLGRMLSHRYLFEAFRNPANITEINRCIGKLNSDREALFRAAKREGRKLREKDQPRLAILSPTLSQETLAAFHAVPDFRWATGVYQLGKGLRTHLIAVHQLPVNPDTLWLRLVGRDSVQQEAIAELLALPKGDRMRQQAVEYLSILQIEVGKRHNLGKDERGLMMNFSVVYEQWRQDALDALKQEAVQLAKQDIQAEAEQIQAEAEQIGEQRGRQELVLRLLSRRVGVLSDEARSHITQLSIDQLDELAEALLDFSSAEDLTAWFAAKL
ncbi:MAG: DUF4351 domain-containing protein [Oculatellaceae cyanobacterium Prado106]|jgi:hypothetical protein|nr:DUF4351 domain-containing protein [Oculatellaceae cyanobacterium Prado106]